ncbi:hypothetical protein LuPra_01446 [Luteitalea pratensis]|uniref:DUF1453 domain-containing protein n=1 Tax=Luteitalea pratensis TaxID=1855912 RepID=A0A143PI56_LUTPR|nr:hypothetical protein [Luteitalea pratensis]AMY08252.1 hypothetical protein LuPra_01446 [Luteitalea pratensis]
MPLIVGLVLVALVLPLVLLPVSVVQRYRMGTARGPARAWVANLNIGGFLVAAGVVVITSTITALWVPSALSATSGALLAGALLGMIGLSLSHWETQAGQLYFTPNRWLVGALTMLVVARLAYGAWRLWDAWLRWGGESGWIASAGASGSLAAGALLIGYGLGFWSAVRWRIARRKAALLMQI